MKKTTQWYHWILLGICSVWMLTVGVMNIVWGAAKSSRFYEIDDVFVRILGVGFILFSLFIFLRRNWAFIGAICILVISILEIVMTDQIEVASIFDLFIYLTTMKIVIYLFFLAPIGLLIWLCIVFTNNRTG